MSPRSHRGAFDPDLADDVRLGVDGADPAAELAPEVVVVNLVGDIEPPAVDAELHPLAADVPEELADLVRIRIELRQGGQAPPGLVIGRLVRVVGEERELLDVEPVEIGRIRAVLQDVVELEEAAAGVVEDAVEHDANPSRVRLVDHPPQRGVAAQHRVDFLVVVGVIAMIRRRLEDRREIHGAHAQVDQVIQVLHDADQVAALISVIGRRRTPFVEVARLRNGHAPGEPVGEDLVEDRVADPVGRLGFGHRVLHLC